MTSEKKDKKWFTKWWAIVIYAIIGFIILGIILGEGSNQGGTTPQNLPQTEEASNSIQTIKPTTVQTIGSIYISAKNWDSDAEADGLSFDLSPQDADGAQVSSAGIISIKLWKMVQVNYENKCLKRDQDLLEKWDSIPITDDDYSFVGAEVKAEYKSYKVTSDAYAAGCAEVIFTTQDGKSFTALEENIWMNYLI